MHWAKVQILLHAVGSFTLNQREDCSRMIFCIMAGFFDQDHLEYWCICKQTKTLGRLNKLDKLQICIYDFVCDIQTTYWSDCGPNNAIHDYYALKQRPGSEGCWHILSAKTFDFQLSWPHTLLHPPFHIEIIPVWITGPWCKMLIKPNCNHKVAKTYMWAAFVLFSFRIVVLNFSQFERKPWF